jgi:protoporphyrinogen/coproporphyrinogen III oxidase
MFELFGSPLMTNILPSIWHDVMSSRGLNDLEHSDETVESFISRRFSPTIAANLIDPLISGIYAGDISKLSVESVFPSLKRLERLYGSVVRGAIQDAFHKTKSTGGVPVVHSPFVESARLAASVSFSGGMSTFTNALAAAISVR